MLQNEDRRVVFAIPYEMGYTPVGTTDEPWQGAPAKPRIDDAETDYLLGTISRYFSRPIGDILFRRSKLGLHVPAGTTERLDSYLST
jgi:glycerol-3-phosphate dehydrogenase